MKVITQKVAQFSDIERSQIPLVNISNARLEDFKLIVRLRAFGVRSQPYDFILFYGDEEVATDDYKQLLRKLKQLNGK